MHINVSNRVVEKNALWKDAAIIVPAMITFMDRHKYRQHT